LSGLTPAERRGASVLAMVLAIGALTDLQRAAHLRRAPALSSAPARVASGTAAGVALDSAAPVGPARAAARASGVRAGALLDLDTATASDLDRLPGIGPVLAARIVEQRRLHGRFRRVDELLSVPGIGPRLLERLRPWLREPGP